MCFIVINPYGKFTPGCVGLYSRVLNAQTEGLLMGPGSPRDDKIRLFVPLKYRTQYN